MSIFRASVIALLLGTAPALAADRRGVVPPVPGEPYYFQLAPMFVPVITRTGIPRQVSIAVAIQIADGADAKGVEERRPELDNAFLSDIYRYVQQRGGIGVPNGEVALKQRLLETAQHILDPVAVKEIEIEEFFQQAR
jgi:flagellar basal body-associated protein FliL